MRKFVVVLAAFFLCTSPTLAEFTGYFTTGTGYTNLYSDQGKGTLSRQLRDKILANEHHRHMFTVERETKLRFIKRTRYKRREYRSKTKSGPRGEEIRSAPEAFIKDYEFMYVEVLNGPQQGQKAWTISSYIIQGQGEVKRLHDIQKPVLPRN